jgi:hypothetical protein
MSNRAHKGRCFRQWRRTRARKLACGERWDPPIRKKVPVALRPFMALMADRQKYAGIELMSAAAARYADHQVKIGAPARRSPRGR